MELHSGTKSSSVATATQLPQPGSCTQTSSAPSPVKSPTTTAVGPRELDGSGGASSGDTSTWWFGVMRRSSTVRRPTVTAANVGCDVLSKGRRSDVQGIKEPVPFFVGEDVCSASVMETDLGEHPNANASQNNLLQLHALQIGNR
jgi:hypothetical protein